MPVMLKRADGKITPMKNAQYLPAFYLIPEGIRQKCGKEINSIPRELSRLWEDRSVHEIIESDLFLLAIIDAYAYMVWPFITPDTMKMEVYSGYDPVWTIAHIPDYWINEMTFCGILPSVQEMFSFPTDYRFPIVPDGAVDLILKYTVPRAMTRYRLWGVVETAKKYHCFEDFDEKESNQKTDFFRKWYHTRTKHPQISLEKIQEENEMLLAREYWDDDIVSEVDVNSFINTLSVKDRKLLQLRNEGETYENIAKAIGYKTHSAVGKRLKTIGKKYEDFAKVDLGFRK